MKSIGLSTLAIGSWALGACASTPGTRPLDMSAAQHDQAAGMAEAQATPHASQYDPDARTTLAPPGQTQCSGQTPCWTSQSNPTQEHLQDAQKYRKIAADHRAAAQALLGAEARDCVGLSNDDRDTSPFFHREDITAVQPAYEHISSKLVRDQVVGAVVVFRAVPGLTAQWLQRIVECHVARNGALGVEVPEMSYCPLVPKGITANVSSSGDGLAVTIASKDPDIANEVLRRAQALRNPR